MSRARERRVVAAGKAVPAVWETGVKPESGGRPQEIQRPESHPEGPVTADGALAPVPVLAELQASGSS